MKREYTKINNKMEDLIPLENTLKEVKAINNIQELIKSKGNNLENISEEDIRLAQII